MKFSYLLLFVICIVITRNSSAQNWAPIGAIWTYTNGTVNPNFTTFSTFESLRDTFINGKACRIMWQDAPFTIGSHSRWHYMYSDSNKVYFLNKDTSEWCLLYDFNAVPGDTFVLNCHISFGDTIRVTIDSVGQINVNGNTLKVQYYKIQANPDYGFNGRVIQGIGYERYMYPTYENIFTGPLRCYEDTSLGLYETGAADSCNHEYYSFIEDKTADVVDIGIFPNPSSGEVNISTTKHIEKIELYNSLGKLIKQFKSDSSIYVGNIANGLYILVLTGVDGSMIVKKLVINSY